MEYLNEPGTWQIYKECRFEAAHVLPKHSGKCSRPHGHSYRVEFWITGEKLNHQGFVVDFGILSNIVKEYDHQDLNQQEPFKSEEIDTTAENIAQVFAKKTARAILDESDEFNTYEEIGIRFIRVKIWETRTGSASYLWTPMPSMGIVHNAS